MLRNEIRAIKQVRHEEKNYVVHTLSQPFTAEEHWANDTVFISFFFFNYKME